METLKQISEVITLLENRASVRDYDSRDLPDSLLDKILNTARQAPTSSNIQAYSLVVVRSKGTRKQLASIAGEQSHILAAPVMVAVCADLHRLAQIGAVNEQTMLTGLCDLNLIAIIDSALVGMCASLVAESLGLGTVMIGGLRNDPEAVAKLLQLPVGVFCPFGLCIGWPATKPLPKPRLPSEAVIFRETYNAEYPQKAIAYYDEILSRHHSKTGRDSGQTWSSRLSDHLRHPSRVNLAEALKCLGFIFR